MTFPSSICFSVDQRRQLQNDFEVEYAFQRFSIEKIGGKFTLTGLVAPALVTEWGAKPFAADIAECRPEVTAFQERLDERIASLSGNHDLMRNHWEIVERTREFRMAEFLEPLLAHQVIDETANLLTSLIEKMPEKACSVLQERLQRRCDLLNGRPPRTRKAKLHVIS